MVYVALLRGINVGGKVRIDMKQLKDEFEKLGFSNVLTYINSGNVIFEDRRGSAELIGLIENMLAEVFKLNIPVILRSKEQIDKLCTTIPADWTNDKEQKTDVMFLWPEIDSPDILQKIKINSDIENVLYVSGALVWSIGRKNVTRGGGIKLIKTDFYKHMTVRNINTVRKICEIMAEKY